MDKQVQTAQQMFRGRMFNRDNTRRKEERILVLKTGIAGAHFWIQSEEEQRALDELQPGTELLLYREPENEYDQWAIAVYLNEDDKIGYITRFKNETIARLMDAGKKFVATVDDPADEIVDEQEEPKRKRRKAPTESNEVQFSIFLVEEA